MNRTAITLAIVALIGIMFSGVVILAIFRPDATATVIAFIGQTLTSLITAVVIFYNLDKVSKKVEKVERQTNGINTALLAQVTDHSEDTIQRYKGEGK